MNTNEINTIINSLFSALSIPAEKGLEYISVQGQLEVYWAIFSTVFFLMCLVLFIKMFKNEIKDTCCVPVIAGLLCSLCFAVNSWHSFMLWYVSPEAWAVKYIINHLN